MSARSLTWVELRLFLRYVAALWTYFEGTVTPDDCRRQIVGRLESRSHWLLSTLDRAVLAWPESPYRRLLDHAGIERQDVVDLIDRQGLEGALDRLYEAGLYVTLEEFQGLRPIRRPGLELEVSAADFDNPLAARHYEVRSGGSRGTPRPVIVDLALVEYDAFHHGLMLDAFELWDRPKAIWYPLPPGVAGLKQVLRNLKLGHSVDRWFTQTRLRLRPHSISTAAMTLSAYAVARARGVRFPFPVSASAEDALLVARWAEQRRGEGRPALLACTPSSGVRVCLAAGEHGLDITGTSFRFGGEAYTPAKAKVVEAAGCAAIAQYLVSEIGVVGDPCALPDAVDDVHLASDKVAVIGRPLGHGPSAALYVTSLHPGSAKVMINVELGDEGVLSERTCGCPLGELGLRQHASQIRSYDKVTTEGMNVLGGTLLRLVEEILPARFGGHPTDYQFVEQEAGGITRILLLISPRVGHVDAGEARSHVLAVVAAEGRPEALMADVWEDAGTIEVVRRDPFVTPASKTLPLYRLPSG